MAMGAIAETMIWERYCPKKVSSRSIPSTNVSTRSPVRFRSAKPGPSFSAWAYASSRSLILTTFAVWWLTAFCQYWKRLRTTISAAILNSGMAKAEKLACPERTR